MEVSGSIVQVRLGAKFLALMLTLISSSLYLSLYSAMPEFIKTYTSFGYELSLVNSMVFPWYKWLLPISLIGLIPCIILVVSNNLHLKFIRTVWRFIAINLISSLLLQAIIVYSLNAPIFDIGATL